MGYGNPDFVKYAEAYGASGYRFESAGALLPLLEHCIKTLGVHVIDSPVDYGENDRILNDELRARSLAV
ncbi:thiamine pyrophosphate-dependent enzyme [Tatumella saanichensis]|uniref:thiamine pyrophosphate-dependent enzyme n=1 Tax=Tatumella saanichensis TaxID=480813 RepID=UPI0005703F16